MNRWFGKSPGARWWVGDPWLRPTQVCNKPPYPSGEAFREREPRLANQKGVWGPMR